MIDFICEVSSNHNGDLQRALQFIYTAKCIGATGVKFQLFKIDQLFAPEALRAKSYLNERRAWELPVSYIPTLADYTHELGLQFACTPFYMDAIDELYPYVDFYKVASYQVLWLGFLRALHDTGKPVAMSLGMADRQETDSAVGMLDSRAITLLHCVSSYPTPIQDCHLARIDDLRLRYLDCQIGWSDHSVRPEVLYSAALKHDASMIEFHMDIDGAGAEYKLGHCWLPDVIMRVITTINNGLLADGNLDQPLSRDELNERLWRTDPSDGLRPLLATRRQLAHV